MVKARTLLPWPVLRQLTGGDLLGRGAAARSPRRSPTAPTRGSCRDHRRRTPTCAYRRTTRSGTYRVARGGLPSGLAERPFRPGVVDAQCPVEGQVAGTAIDEPEESGDEHHQCERWRERREVSPSWPSRRTLHQIRL